MSDDIDTETELSPLAQWLRDVISESNRAAGGPDELSSEGRALLEIITKLEERVDSCMTYATRDGEDQ